MDRLASQRLFKAVRSGNLAAMKKELADDNGSGIHITTHKGNTLLHIAVRSGYRDLVNEIIQRDPKLVLRRNHRNETPVHIAATGGHASVIEALLQSVKKSPEAATGKKIARMKDIYGSTPVHCAVNNCHVRVVWIFGREDPASLASYNKAGDSPLSIAIHRKFNHIAYYIIDKYPDALSYKGPEDRTLLHNAILKQNSEIIRVLLQEKRELLKVEDVNNRNPLHYAAAFGDNKLGKWLLEEDTSVAYQADRNNKQLPVHLAAENGHRSVLRTLISACPDTIEWVDKKQRNILHLAAKNGRMDAVKFILSLPEMEDLANSQDMDGNTPLHLAAMNLHSGVVRMLTRNPRVEIRATNQSNKTALAIAQSNDDGGMELHKHCTIKALKAAYAKHALNPEEILENLQYRIASNVNIGRGTRSEEMARTLNMMATVIATFTFAAAFTIPGGYKSGGRDEGMATLIEKSSFQAFIVTDTLAMTSAMTAAVLVFWSSACRDNELLMDTLPFAIGLTWIALVSMALAFVTGLFVVLSGCQWLAILVCVIGSAPPAILYIFAPTFLYVFDHLFSSQTSQGRRYNVVETNPFTFVFKLAKLIS